VLLAGCATRPASTESTADAAIARSQLAVPDELVGMSLADLRARIARDLQTPVEFHGQVVTVAGEPVPDAAVQLRIYDHILEPFEPPYVAWTELAPVTTGRDGRFEVRDRQGAGLYVRVTRPGWKSLGNSQRLVWFADDFGQSGDDAAGTAADPVRFVLEPGLPSEDYLPIRSGAVPLPRDGGEVGYRIDVRNPNGVEPAEGDFAIGCTKGPVQSNGRWDWMCRLRMPAGSGLQLRRDIVVQQAPEAGYQAEFQFGMAADDPDWDHRAERFFYVVLRDGTLYGHFDLRIRTAGDFFFNLHGFVNRSGSRQLDYADPAYGRPLG
jgi:hypothetical protein